MRDILVTAIVFAGLAFAITNPYIGVLLWSWIGYMSPHRLGWGFAYNFPFALLIAIVTLISLFVARKKLDFFWTYEMSWLLLLNIWFLFTTFFSLQPESSWDQWYKVIKIQLFIFITLWVMNDKKKIDALIWVIVISIGFYGVKGGIFTLTSGGENQVLGPEGSFISGNTEIGLAMVMILPLIWYLFLHSRQKIIRIGMLAAMLLTPVAILGTHSRGALLGIGAIASFLWLKSRKKLAPLILILLMIPFVFIFMPQEWHDRMASIGNPEEDSSAMGRIYAWTFAFQLAKARPIGGGFESFTNTNYERFAPNVTAVTDQRTDAHSIYFEILGEQGFIGLAIFLFLGILMWKNAKEILKLTQSSEQQRWAYDLAAMIQVSLIGYATGGAFLGLSYFDLPYHLLAILILVRRIVQNEFAGLESRSHHKIVASNAVRTTTKK